MNKNFLLIALLAITASINSVKAYSVAPTAETATQVNQEPSLLQRGALWVAEKAVAMEKAAVEKVKAMPAGKDRDDLILKMYKALDKADGQFADLAKQDNNVQFVNRVNALRAQIADAKRSLPPISAEGNARIATPVVNPILPR